MGLEELLSRMVEIDSVYPEEHELSVFLEEFLEEHGFEVDRVPLEEDRFCIVADRGDPEIGFYGHLDTVPVQGDWSRDPFEPQVEDGRMYGLGAFDMLGGIASFLTAAADTQGDIRLMLGVDEELYSRGAYELVEQGYLDDLDFLVVPEIADTSRDKDFLTAILGRRGRVAVDIDVEGEPAHGAQPDEGESAVERSMEVIRALEDLQLREHEELGEETFFVRKINSESGSLSIPEEAEIVIDAHIVPPTTPESFLQKVQALMPGYAETELGDRPNPYLEPYVVEDTEVEGALEEVDEVVHYETGYGMSVADENVLAEEVPVLVLGPEGGNPHDADEWVNLQSLRVLTRIFERLVR